MMNANPQAAAEQDRKSYRDLTTKLSLRGLDPATPHGVRSLTEKSVARTREAYDRSMDAFEASVATFERSFDAAGQGAAAFNRKIRAINPGWYGMENNGKLSSGSFSNQGECLTRITERGAIFEHRPGCGPSSVPSAEASTSGRARG